MLNIVFMGTPDFAVPSLNALHNSTHDVIGVVTTPDSRTGRGLKISSSAVKNYAKMFNIPILQPSNLSDDKFLSSIKQMNPDIYIVVAFKILPESLLSIPKLGTVNLHASLLPKYRGAAPINHAILNGDGYTGITTFFIDKEIDTGEILLQEKILIDETATTGELMKILSHNGAELMIQTMDGILHKTIIPKKQDDRFATFAPKINISDCKIDWKLSAKLIHNKIRAYSPLPGAFTFYNNKRIKLFDSKIDYSYLNKKLKPGRIKFNDPSLQIGTGSNPIIINNIQLEGKKIMPVTQFILGYPTILDETFG